MSQGAVDTAAGASGPCWWPAAGVGGRKPAWGRLRVHWGFRKTHEKLTLEQEGGRRRSQEDGASAEVTARAKDLRQAVGTVQSSPGTGHISVEGATGSVARFEQEGS